MSRLSGRNILEGEAFQIQINQDKQKEVAHNMIVEAELRAQEIMEAAKNKARLLIEAAQKRAQALIEEGESQRESIMQQASEQGEASGFGKGYEQGFSQIQAETVELLEGARTILEGSYEAKNQILKASRRNMAEVIRYLSTRIFHQAIELNPVHLLNIVDEAVESLHLTGRVKIAVSPDCLENLRQFSPESQMALNRLTRLEFLTDKQLDMTEVFVLNQDGNFNLSIASQVSKLLQGIEKELPIPEVSEETVEEAFPEAVIRPEETIIQWNEPGVEADEALELEEFGNEAFVESFTEPVSDPVSEFGASFEDEEQVKPSPAYQAWLPPQLDALEASETEGVSLSEDPSQDFEAFP
ncbi:MAG: hypothetical protein K2X66_08340 [Cyanobacteria bacterium]|nr:hypothetical protein [Cyanobacteriota bacterium]